MKAVIQRVTKAQLKVDGETVSGVREHSVTACEEKVLQPA